MFVQFQQMIEKKQSSQKRQDKQDRRLFTLNDLLRCKSVSISIGSVISFMVSLPYMIPILDTAFKTAKISSITATIISFITSQLRIMEQNCISAGIIAGFAALIITTLIIISVTIQREGSSGVNHKIKSTVFRLLALALISFVFPLSMFLAGAALKQLSIQPLLSVLCTLDLVCIYVLAYFIVEVESVDLSTSSMFAKIRARGDGLIMTGKLTIACLFHLSLSENRAYFLIILAAALLIALIQLYEFLLMTKFYQQTIQQLLTLTILLNTILISESIAILLMSDTLLHANFQVLTFSLLAFTSLSVKAYRNNRTAITILANPRELSSQSEAIVYVMEIMKVGAEGNHDSIERPFLISNHMRFCSELKCFCHKSRSQPVYKLTRNRIFMHDFVLAILDTLRKRYPSSLPILSLFLHAKLSKHPTFSRIQYLLQQFKTRNAGFDKSYAFYQFKIMIQRQVKEEEGKIRNHLPLEHSIKEEENQVKLKESLTRMADTLAKKYRLMTQEVVQLQEVVELGDNVNLHLRKVEQLWHQYSSSGSLHIVLDPLFLFYFQSLIPSPLEARHLKEKMLEKLQRLHSINKKNSILVMYSQKACVFESFFNNNIGIISNVSKSVSTTLKIERNQLLGKDVHETMPPFLAKGHKQILEKWLSGESFKIDHGMESGMFIDPEFIAFNCMTYIKMLSDGGVLRLYKLVVRNSQSDCLLLSKEGRIEGIGAGLIDVGLLKNEDLHSDVGIFTDRNILLRPDCLIQKKWIQLQRSSVLNEDSEISEFPLFECCVMKREQKLGDVSFLVISFLDIRKSKVSENKVFQEIFRLNSSNIRILESIKNAGDQMNSYNSSQEEIKSNDVESYCATDTNSSLLWNNCKTTNYANFIIQLKKMTCNPDKISLKWKNIASVALIGLIFMAIAAFVVQETIVQKSFESIGGVLKSSRITSNNNFILEVLYNNAVMIKAYCDDLQYSSHCANLQHFSQDILKEFYQLYVDDLKAYFSTTTYLNHLKLSENVNEPTTLILHNKSVTVPAHQFVEYFYSWLKNIQFKIEKHELAEESFELVFLNFQSLKRVNYKAISFFQQAGELELTSFLKIYIILMVIIVLIITFFLGLMQFYMNSQKKKKIELLNCYNHISRKTATLFSLYFSSGHSQMKQLPQIQDESMHECMSNHQEQYHYHSYLIVILVLIAIPLVFFMIFPVATLLPPSSTALRASIALAKSQSHLIESYFQLKTFYMGFNFSKTQAQFESDILSRLNQTELEFARIIRSNLHVFSDLDSTFGPQFNSILTQSICKLTEKLIDEHEVQFCTKSENRNILSRGVMTAMYFLQRNTIKTLMQLGKSTQVNRGDYFSGAIFQDMDNFMIFMLKMFSIIQERIVLSLQSQVPQRVTSLLMAHTAVIVIGLVIWFFWLLLERKEKENASNICGYTAQLPDSILSKKHVMQKIKKVLSMK